MFYDFDSFDLSIDDFIHGQSKRNGHFLQYVRVGIKGTITNPKIEKIIRIPSINHEKFAHSKYMPATKGMNQRSDSSGMKILYFSANRFSSLFLNNVAAISPKPVVHDVVSYKGQYVHSSRAKPKIYKTTDKKYKIKIISPN
jgi:hypothetical protein